MTCQIIVGILSNKFKTINLGYIKEIFIEKYLIDIFATV